MGKKIIAALLAGILLLQVPLQSFAWGKNGHRIVGEIAYRHLTKKAQKAVDKLLGRQKLALVANWPDFIKSDTTGQYKHIDTWHYIDAPSEGDEASFLQFLQNKKEDNAYNKGADFIKTLKDPSASQEDKLFALILLTHVVGDIHQPLHVGTSEEGSGGNKISVTWNGLTTNLHSVWDDKLIEFQGLSYTEYSNALDTASAAEVKAIQQGSYVDWMYESHLLANGLLNEVKSGDKLNTFRYTYYHIGMLDRQLLKGGLRLAAVLNEIYK
ncbi:S1/P1 Nuclease [Chitinophaga costaii]|uniref:S1/P1 Nuclease n=1 Tax=Chitinophaga costaii TaxID=1335309 RepID=A0A1C4AYN0_9BACT|nr:S1/P1 nuclease [Chitinophaga costaii]PUZ26804.1 S1/P1 Nuclease [Chitinophaga costaii]SCB99689.1 S1/P1 Nuclease [Chitinophaga costaii]